MRYELNDMINTKYGVGQIRNIYSLNESITVFETWMFNEQKMRNVFYGEIEGVVRIQVSKYVKSSL